METYCPVPALLGKLPAVTYLEFCGSYAESPHRPPLAFGFVSLALPEVDEGLTQKQQADHSARPPEPLGRPPRYQASVPAPNSTLAVWLTWLRDSPRTARSPEPAAPASAPAPAPARVPRPPRPHRATAPPRLAALSLRGVQGREDPQDSGLDTLSQPGTRAACVPKGHLPRHEPSPAPTTGPESLGWRDWKGEDPGRAASGFALGPGGGRSRAWRWHLGVWRGDLAPGLCLKGRFCKAVVLRPEEQLAAPRPARHVTSRTNRRLRAASRAQLWPRAVDSRALGAVAARGSAAPQLPERPGAPARPLSWKLLAQERGCSAGKEPPGPRRWSQTCRPRPRRGDPDACARPPRSCGRLCMLRIYGPGEAPSRAAVGNQQTLGFSRVKDSRVSRLTLDLRLTHF
ncbi:uncharacterized protein LOC111816626 [Octodon degus]|uniref:Uncharacterized protein LOC111816626 n=1 Tax=Octodon degus TaxID=10160 RepID=A0A6P6EDL3_OCTDE|nr:uncharacterized protein LOC111816626 [Octodon degus]